MQLSDEQVARFRRDGFLLFPGLFSKAEIAVLRAETARLASVEADSVIRERTGGVRSIFRVHEDDGATRSAAFRALVRTPRVLAPTRQALGTDEVYVYHTKINTKPAIEGTVWMWHQDRSEEHTSELQSPCNLVCRLLLEKKKKVEYLHIS